MSKLRIAIVGCNNMGKKHLECLRNNFADDVEISGILNNKTTKERAAELGVHAFENLETINKKNTDAVIIATPAETHASIAENLLSRKLPCLIEKPLGANEQECESIENIAKKYQTPFLVGHLENYNPAVVKLKESLEAPIKSIKAIRTSRNVNAQRKTSVVSELMIHDLAIVTDILDVLPQKIVVSKHNQYDWSSHAKVKLNYQNAEVELESLIADKDVIRTMDIEDAKANNYHIDFPSRKLTKNNEILCEGGNSLYNEQRNFISMIKGQEAPYVSFSQALKSVVLFNKIEQQITNNQIISEKIKNFQKNL